MVKFPFNSKQRTSHGAALRVAFIYASFSLLWIFFSDKILLYFVKDPEILTKIQMIKGWAFVLITAFIVYALLLREIIKVWQAEGQLREGERKYREIFDATSDAIFYLRAEDGKIEDVNQAMLNLYGYTYEEALHLSIGDLSSGEPPYSQQEAVSFIKSSIEHGPQHFEWRARKKNREYFWTEVTLTTSEYSGAPMSIAVVRDITKRKRAEEERERLEGQLRQSQKMEAVGQLAGGVAHDFNNLLQVILGYSDLALDETDAGSSIRASIEEILKASKRAKTLVRQLLAFSRRQVLDMQDVDLNNVIANLTEMIRRLIGEHIALNVLAGHNLGIVRADQGQIEQILINLCVNARDAMPNGGTIIVETENVRIDEAYCETCSWAKPGRYVLLSVTDTGCGMDKETLANIFEPFFTTKGVGEGTGLGLSTVYGLVKQHQGMVNPYSEVGKGTAFKIYLPLAERSAVAVGNKIEGDVPDGAETILLAEDEQTVRELTKSILERSGYTVLAACDGEEAITLFEEHADEIDLVLLDVMMPKLGGAAVFERIHKARPQTRALFSSGYSMNDIHTHFVLDQGLALIQKPYQRDNLLRKIREVIDAK